MAITDLIAQQQGPDTIGAMGRAYQLAGMKQQLSQAGEAEKQRKRQEGAMFAANTALQLEKVQDPLQRAQIYQRQLQAAEQAGYDVRPFPMQYDERAQGLLNFFKGQVYGGKEYEAQLKGGASAKGFAPVPGTDTEGNPVYVGMVFDPATRTYKSQSIQSPEGVTLNTESPTDKLARSIAEAQAKANIKTQASLEQERGVQEIQTEAAAGKKAEEVRGKGMEERRQVDIQAGYDAAQGVPILRRSLELLDSVKTGGFNAAALRAKQVFGIESANEAELSASLGKAVLAQLRPIFGAQFTEREGKRLEQIEAGFGKSTEGNRALLKQTLEIAEKAAQRGIKSAIEAKDYRTAAEIQDAMNFTLGNEAPQGQPQAEKSGGQLMIDAQGNRAVVYPDGTYEEQ